MRSLIFRRLSFRSSFWLLLGSGFPWALLAALLALSGSVLANEGSANPANKSIKNPPIEKAEVITQRLQLLRPVDELSIVSGRSSTSDASSLIIFEYQDQESLVLADTEWEHLDKQSLNDRERFVLRFFKKKLIKPNSSNRSTGLTNTRLTNEFDAELEMLSAYFAKHDNAFEIIQRLDRTSLKLKYAPNTFRTDVRGNRLQVTGATVLFDPHAYALVESNQYSGKEHSRMSSADALLHELLHAEMALRQSKHFIASGAMGGIGYPVEHEHEIIERERLLFKAMTAQDGVQRPSRHNHAGTIAVSRCSLCLR